MLKSIKKLPKTKSHAATMLNCWDWKEEKPNCI